MVERAGLIAPVLIGYETAEEFIQTHRAADPVFVMSISETSTNKVGLTLSRTFLMLSDVRDGLGRYCRIHIGSTQVVAGFPLSDTEQQMNVEKAFSAEEAMVKHLKDNCGFLIERAAITRLDGYVMIEGQTNLIVEVGTRFILSADKKVVSLRRNEPATSQVRE